MLAVGAGVVGAGGPFYCVTDRSPPGRSRVDHEERRHVVVRLAAAGAGQAPAPIWAFASL